MTTEPGIAFLILAHDNPAQLARLIDRLRPHPVFLHIDAKSESAAFRACLERSHVTPTDRMAVNWGGFSMVDATMTLLRRALAEPATRHAVLLSGSCYPIRPIAELAAALADAGDAVRYLPISSGTPHLLKAVRQRWFFDLQQHRGGTVARRAAQYGSKLLLPRRSGPPDGLVPHFGSQWWGLSRACAELVLSEYDNNAALVAYYRRVLAPDEHFVQTIVANSEFADPRHLISYRGAETFAETALHHIRITAGKGRRQGPKPALLDPATCLDAMRRSRKFFARKLDPRAPLDLVDRELLGAA
jgi:hypothetical protein